MTVKPLIERLQASAQDLPVPTVPTRVTRLEAERMIVEASASDLPEMQALEQSLPDFKFIPALSKPLPLWNKVWQLPAFLALGILMLFAVLFRYKEEPAKAEL